jgi:hypothetical protein
VQLEQVEGQQVDLVPVYRPRVLMVVVILVVELVVAEQLVEMAELVVQV